MDIDGHSTDFVFSLRSGIRSTFYLPYIRLKYPYIRVKCPYLGNRDGDNDLMDIDVNVDIDKVYYPIL
jgi:hypothetical protein